MSACRRSMRWRQVKENSMGLIKPPLWYPEASLREAAPDTSGRPLNDPGPPNGTIRRSSPLRTRTARLLQRLRAQQAKAVVRVSAAPSAAHTIDDADLNHIQLTGTLGSEPLLYDAGDHPVAALALACQRRWRDASGTCQLETTWLNLIATDELAERCGRSLHRGDRVYVEGSLRLWAELRGPHSYGCHTIALDRIVLLAAGRCAPDVAHTKPCSTLGEATEAAESSR